MDGTSFVSFADPEDESYPSRAFSIWVFLGIFGGLFVFALGVAVAVLALSRYQEKRKQCCQQGVLLKY